jgi:hypothetical protein
LSCRNSGSAPALQENQVDLHPDAADADHFADHVDRHEPIEEVPVILAQGQAVLGEKSVDHLVLFVVADRDPDRRILGYPRPPVGHRRQLGERPATGASIALPLDVDRHLPAVGGFEIVDQVVGWDAVVPDVELRHCCVPAHAPAVSADSGADGGGRSCRFDPDLAGGHRQAGGEALDVPL